MVTRHPHPVVLSIAGHDPSGGAGLQADIETLGVLGCRAVTVTTCLTVQDTLGMREVAPVDAALLGRQMETLLEDLPVVAVKIGLLGSTGVAEEVARRLERLPEVPVILDPVLAAGDGTPVADARLRETLLERLLPRLTLITPNGPEAAALGGGGSPAADAARLRHAGADWVLITGGHGPEPDLVNRLYGPDGEVHEWRLLRRSGAFHGTGCTLSAAITAGLARGRPMPDAVALAQRFTQAAVERAQRPGRGQALPSRLFPCIPGWEEM